MGTRLFLYYTHPGHPMKAENITPKIKITKNKKAGAMDMAHKRAPIQDNTFLEEFAPFIPKNKPQANGTKRIAKLLENSSTRPGIREVTNNIKSQTIPITNDHSAKFL